MPEYHGADGLNVAWNYQSAWIEGLAATDQLRLAAKVRPAAEAMISAFLAEEGFEALPRTWRYTSGDIFAGWTAASGLSANTPAWPGDRTNTQAAHVSYRSMDAMALLAARRVGVGIVPERLVAHFRRLVEDGQLYPFVAEELALVGAAPVLPHHVARVSARSVLPWQVQSQIWALAAIARQLPD